MENLFVSYEIAIQLKEKGFDYNCLGFYGDDGKLYFDNIVSNFCDGINSLYHAAPLHQQAIDWLLQKLDFYYPGIAFQIFSDYSGSWIDFENNIELLFINLNEAIESGLKLLEKWI